MQKCNTFFWVKSNLTVKHMVQFIVNQIKLFITYQKEYTITTSCQHLGEKNNYLQPGDTNGDVLKASAGAIDNNNGEGLWVQFSFSLWVVIIKRQLELGHPTKILTSNQTNFLSSTDNNLELLESIRDRNTVNRL